MSKKWLIVAALIIVIAVAAKPLWQIISGHNYAADTTWLEHNDSNPAQIDHSGWQTVLDDYLVSDDPSGINLFDYQALDEDGTDELDDYLAQMQSLDIRQYSRAEQFAYWVNLYNSLTIKVIADNYPVGSIREIAGSGIGGGPWNNVATVLHGHEVTLNDIEHRILRPIWQDYRIHFAVNCASIGCPNLQDEAFTASNTEELLESSANQFLQHPRALALDGDTLKLSSILKWYQVDFGDNETQMLETIAEHLSPAQQTAIAGKHATQYHYDWSLNAFDPN